MTTRSLIRISPLPHQEEALTKLKTGSILRGGVGTGKTLTALIYFLTVELKTKVKFDGTDPFLIDPKIQKSVYIITTARKRDSLDWENEWKKLGVYLEDGRFIVDSWNNIKKYVDVENAFFIFDEQRVLGSGSWVKSFLKITKKNNWILLSATPGDSWKDYIPVFVANGFFKNRTHFARDHIVYAPYTRYPKIQKYINTALLHKYKTDITVEMPFERQTVRHTERVYVDFSKVDFKRVYVDRWDIFEDEPIKETSKLYYLMRKVVNSDKSRFQKVLELHHKHPRLIVFYNFDYELYILRTLKDYQIPVFEYNGHVHDPVPKGDEWIYLVQYTSGREAWNCVETNAIIFYSMNYSYMFTEQASGRIDRMNTKYKNLYYYTFVSKSFIDLAIAKALRQKRDFNEIPI